MHKAAILDYFGITVMILSVLAAIGMFYFAATSDAFGHNLFWFYGVFTIIGGILQYGLLCGAAEVISRLISIDESLKRNSR